MVGFVVSRVGIATTVIAVAAGVAVFLWSNQDGRSLAPTTSAVDDVVQEALRQGKPTVAEFGANACAACREMKPVLETLRRVHGKQITVVEVDLIASREAGYLQRYGIRLMPTQVFYDARGRETSRHMGKISADEILMRLNGHGQ